MHSSPAATAADHARFVRWRAAIFAIFLLSGLMVATWASRVPAIKGALGISTFELGLALLCSGAASIVGLTLAPALLARFGARATMACCLVIGATGVAVVGLSTTLVSYPMLIAGLMLFGLGTATVDVIMNIEGAAIEQRQGSTLLPLFHAFFSLGTVAGALLGAAAAGLGIHVASHTLAIAIAIAVLGVLATTQVPSAASGDGTRDIGARAETRGADAAAPRPSLRERLGIALSAWREPRTYALGVVMLGMSFAEGGANDWLALGIAEGHGHSEALGAMGLAVFSASMTLMRVVGGPLVDRFGRVAVLRVLAVTAVVGMLLFVFVSWVPLLLVGAALWGAGVSLGFPLGMSAAADDPARAAARVSAAATIGYIAFLTGPPALGFLAEHIGLLPTLLVIVVLVIASGLASGAARPLPVGEPARASV